MCYNVKKMCRKSSPKREGRDHRDTPIRRVYASVYPHIGSLVGVTSHITPLPTGEGLGEGPAGVGGGATSPTCRPKRLKASGRPTFRCEKSM